MVPVPIHRETASPLNRKEILYKCDVSYILFQMISLLPARIIKLLEFIGFSGDKVNEKTFHPDWYLQWHSLIRPASMA